MRKKKVATQRRWQRERLHHQRDARALSFDSIFPLSKMQLCRLSQKKIICRQRRRRCRLTVVRRLTLIFYYCTNLPFNLHFKKAQEHDSNHLFYLFRTRLHFKLRAIDAIRRFFLNQLDTIGNSRVYGCARNLRWCHSFCGKKEKR